MIEGAKKLNDQRKFRMIRRAYGFSLVMILIFFLLVLSEERMIAATILFVILLILLITLREVFYAPVIYFSKEFLFFSTTNEQKSIPLNSVFSIIRVSVFFRDILDFPYAKRKFRILYFDSEGNKSSLDFWIVLDSEGTHNLGELLEHIEFGNSNFKAQV